MDVHFKRNFDVQRIAPVEEQACADDDTDHQIKNTRDVKLKADGRIAATNVPELKHQQECSNKDERAACEDHRVVHATKASYQRHQTRVEREPNIPSHGWACFFGKRLQPTLG